MRKKIGDYTIVSDENGNPIIEELFQKPKTTKQSANTNAKQTKATPFVSSVNNTINNTIEQTLGFKPKQSIQSVEQTVTNPFSNYLSKDENYNKLKKQFEEQDKEKAKKLNKEEIEKNKKTLSKRIYEEAEKQSNEAKSTLNNTLQEGLNKEKYGNLAKNFKQGSQDGKSKELVTDFTQIDPLKEHLKAKEKVTSTKEYKEAEKKYNSKEEKQRRRGLDNAYALAKYQYNIDKLKDDDIGIWDRTLGNTISGAKDMFSNLKSNNGNMYVDEKGNRIYMPSYDDLKYEKLQDETDSGFWRFVNDVNHELGKQGARMALSAVPVVGKAAGNTAYFGDVYLDSYKNALNKQAQVNGEQNEAKAGVNAGVNAGMDYVLDKFGSFIGKKTGIKQVKGKNGGDVLDTLTNSLIKTGVKPKVARTVASALTEAGQEGLESPIEKITDLYTIGQDENGNKSIGEILKDPQTYKDMGYSALVGGTTGGAMAGAMPDKTGALTNVYNDYKNDTIVALNNELSKPVEQQNKAKINTYQDLINELDNYTKAPYGKENTINDINSSIANVQSQIAKDQVQNQDIANSVNNFNLGKNYTNDSAIENFNKQLNKINEDLKITKEERTNIINQTKYNMQETNEPNKIKMVNTEKALKNLSNINGNYTNNTQLTKGLVNDIKEHGITDPIYVSNESSQIIDGGHRLLAAQKLGLKEVPVKFVDSANDIDFINNDWYNRIGTELNNESREGTFKFNEGNQDERINNYRGNEIVNNTRNNGTSDKIYQEAQSIYNRPSTEAIYGTNTNMGQELDSSFSNLSNEEQQELKELKESYNMDLMTDEEIKRMEELENKSNGVIKKYSDLKDKNEYKDIKNIYGKYKNSKISTENSKILKQAKSFIETNKQGRRTKEQWLQIAEYIGNNADINNSKDLQKLAMETWFNEKPNNPNVLNRQGKKYVKFPVNEWVNAVYKGAGVGTEVKLSQEERNTISESKQDDVAVLRTPTKIQPKEVKKTPEIEKENIKYSIEEKIEKEVRNQYKGLSEDKIQQIIELKEEQKEKDKMYSNFSNKQRAKQRIMINAYETNAKIRKIVQGDSLQKVKGGLTDTELSKAIEKENSNYIGKNVMADGKKATIIGNPYGRVKVEFEDGSIKTFDKDDITTINKPKQDDVVKMSAKDITNTLNDTKKGIVPDGKKMRRWVDTSNTATGMEDSINKADIDKITYEAQSNKKTFEQASNNLKNLNYEQKVFRASDKLNSNKKITTTDLVEAQIALREAATRGDIKSYLNLQQDIAIMGTELGQMVQSLSMIQKMSPDGQLAMLNKIINRQQNMGNKNWQNVELNEDLVQKVLDSYDDNTHTTFNQQKMDKALDNLKQDIANQMKTTKSEKLNEWRYLSMLGNPKTHIRNVVANVSMLITKRTKDTINSGLQDVFIRDKSHKTTTLKHSSKDVKDLAKIAYNETFDLNKGNKYNEKNEIENRKKVFNNRVIEGLRKANMKALDVEDQVFKKAEFKKRFAKYLTAQGIKTTQDINAHPEIVEQAKAFALEEAKEATFQQDNQIANWINKLDNKGPIAKVARGAIIPFTRTPLNIAKTGIEYAPGTGLLKTISDVKKAPSNMKGNVAINGISKQITGTSLAFLGYALAKSGLVTADAGDDKDDKLETDQGMKMGFSIKLGNKSYDLSWLSPSAMPFFVGATMYDQLEKKEGIDGNIIMEGIANTLDPLSEMSCIKSFTDVLTSYEQSGMAKISAAGQKATQNYLSQFIPTLSSQFARVFDDTKRSTYADKNSNFKFGEETAKQLMYKIPGLRNTLPEQTDYLGRSKKEDDNALVRAFESFLSPANTKKDTASKTTKELINLYKQTGENGVLPSKLDQYIKYNGEKYDLSQKEYNQLKKDFGSFAYEEIKNAMDSSDYNSLSEDKQAEVISNIMKYSKYKAKQNYFEEKGIDYSNSIYSKADKAKDSGYAIADYYITKQYTKKAASTPSDRNRYQELVDKGIDGKTYDEFKYFVSNVRADKDSNGNTIKNSKKKKIIDYIQSLDLTAQQKQNLYNDYKDNQGMFTYYK